MYSLPQEIEVWYVIPAIRKELAKNLVKNQGMTYEKTGEVLGISKSAVSQYFSNKRASKLKLPELIKSEINRSSKIIAKDPKKVLVEIERILKLIKSKKCSCSICKKYNPEILKFCKQETIC
ncbi:MAG: transcriptional regulator [Nanoarchaeota archaeon]